MVNWLSPPAQHWAGVESTPTEVLKQAFFFSIQHFHCHVWFIYRAQRENGMNGGLGMRLDYVSCSICLYAGEAKRDLVLFV